MDKQFFSIKDFCSQTGCSRSAVYKLTSQRLINFYKPFGKRIFFTKEQIQEAMTNQLIKSRKQIKSEVFKEGGQAL